ncbi:transmembrane protein 26-like [Pomacea canaliculata]|uniref:transmembrane protein 26-like n=1 Tax=Pomacea canaliculata TaxID=400727 RepID=UPI000D72E835|nr:transmembrane protein 26-like [Pomacea canaliculata]XP_025110743.1 transmembrane protein 26-like [Pomacea canaliculata]XP_025110752.1 transmembrane protein 26-like [Pomacea canaliculata]XP_025110759.1 transmembrane protein 26-like [Pomacea canaliculata]XP_025110768.1 transmembrane protein 26-like [Pomacea canaliculata]
MTSARVQVTAAQLKALLVRLVLCLHFLLVVWRVTVAWGKTLWFLTCAIAPFLIETIFTIVKRKGTEWKWFSLCFFFYSGATLPGIWLLEIKRTKTYLSANVTSLEDIMIPGLDIPLRLSSDTWVLVMEELLLYLMILGRWILPRGHVGREELSQLLFAFLGMASDMIDLFSLFEEDRIRVDMSVTYALLAVWSWSVLQFSLTFYTAHRPRRARGLQMTGHRHDTLSVYRLNIIYTELAASFVSLFMQDGPFLALRLYTVVVYQTVNHSTIFFICKNILVIFILIYKIVILCHKRVRQKSEEDGSEVVDEGAKDTEQSLRGIKNGHSAKRELVEYNNHVDLEESDNQVTSVDDGGQTVDELVAESSNTDVTGPLCLDASGDAPLSPEKDRMDRQEQEKEELERQENKDGNLTVNIDTTTNIDNHIN